MMNHKLSESIVIKCDGKVDQSIKQTLQDKIDSLSETSPRFYEDEVDQKINPSHYTKWKIPPNEYITANKLEWEVGNVIKYVTRYQDKNGEEDLDKAIKYIQLLKERKYDTRTPKEDI